MADTFNVSQMEVQMGQPALGIDSLTRASMFFVGRDENGRWLARDDRGLTGGIFVDKNAALKFALFESDRRPSAVLLLPEHVELTLTGKLPAWA
jgi:hypothetical protein